MDNDNDDAEADGLGGDGCTDAHTANNKVWEEEGETTECKPSVVLTSLDDLSAVIVGAVMKKAMSDLSKIAQAKLAKDPRIAKVFPDERYTVCVCVGGGEGGAKR